MGFCVGEIHITGRPKVIWLFYYLGYCSLDMDNRIKSRPPVIANIRNRFWPKLIHFWPKLGPASNPNLTFISFRSIMAFNCPIFFRTWSVFHSMDNQSWQFSRTICPSVPTEFAEDHDDAPWVMIDLKIVPPVSWLWFWFILARIELPFRFKLQALHFLSTSLFSGLNLATISGHRD